MDLDSQIISAANEMESFQRPLHTVFMVSNIRKVHAGVFTIEESMLNELIPTCAKDAFDVPQ